MTKINYHLLKHRVHLIKIDISSNKLMFRRVCMSSKHQGKRSAQKELIACLQIFCDLKCLVILQFLQC